MESVHGNGGSRLMVTELSHIKQLVMQLEVHIGRSPELCKHLASQIFSLTERSMGMITSSNLDGGRKRSASDALASATPSTPSDVADVPFKTTKKRSMMEKRKQHVRVSSASGGESPVDDGHSWRKYGQKEILGAKHPRSYYRCTHRHSQGCTATKQVQRTDDDPTLFDVVYLGTHTCVHKAAADQAPELNPESHSLLQSLGANLTVRTDELAAAVEPHGCNAATPFWLPTTLASGCLTPELSPFEAPSTSRTSDSNDAATLPPFEFAAGDAEWWAQSELQEVVSALVAASAPQPAVFSHDEFGDIDISSFLA